MTLKRSREEVAAEAEAMAMANCLVLLSHHRTSPDNNNKTASSLGWELFECKTCKKKFKSFQALGGHRASHKRPKPDPQDLKDKNNLKKKHKCSVCGLEFGLGQALGGHMRKHRADQQQNTAKSADLLTAVVMKNNEEEEKKKVVLFGIDLLDFTTPLLEDDSRVDTRFVVDIPRTTLDLFV